MRKQNGRVFTSAENEVRYGALPTRRAYQWGSWKWQSKELQEVFTSASAEALMSWQAAPTVETLVGVAGNWSYLFPLVEGVTGEIFQAHPRTFLRVMAVLYGCDQVVFYKDEDLVRTTVKVLREAGYAPGKKGLPAVYPEPFTALNRGHSVTPSDEEADSEAEASVAEKTEAMVISQVSTQLEGLAEKLCIDLASASEKDILPYLSAKNCPFQLGGCGSPTCPPSCPRLRGILEGYQRKSWKPQEPQELQELQELQEQVPESAPTQAVNAGRVLKAVGPLSAEQRASVALTLLQGIMERGGMTAEEKELFAVLQGL